MTVLCALLATSMIGFAEPAQGIQDPGPPRGGAFLLLAYEAIKTKQPGPNAKFVAQLNAALVKNPSARATLERILAKWKKVPNKNRLLGAKLGNATLKTRFSDAELASAFSAAPRPNIPLLQAMSELPDPATTKAMKADPARMRVEQTKREAIAGLTPRSDMRAVATPPPAPRTLYMVEATGIYCVYEGTDWGIHTEPYVIFVLWRSAPRECWTVRIGPITMDAGQSFLCSSDLIRIRAGSAPVTMLPVVMENDGWDPDDFQDWLQTFLDTALPYLSTGTMVFNAINMAIDHYRTITQASDDDTIGVGMDQITLPVAAAYANSQVSGPGGIVYDRFWYANGGQSGIFDVFYNIRRF